MLFAFVYVSAPLPTGEDDALGIRMKRCYGAFGYGYNNGYNGGNVPYGQNAFGLNTSNTGRYPYSQNGFYPYGNTNRYF
ncbi:CLUMA_CG008905, isoform A [Clunio marinus]|uniref:CLUMA_CG008905, isoform A n=1 Tax=Clunio marinus TaxID=568069 RepID=A0A1J1I8S7_9DIPT|nr:CLUMA_CG008905, isoform A [Clunio marinus]